MNLKVGIFLLREVRNMALSDTLTQQKFAEILTMIYQKGQDSKNINISDLIEEIKQQVLSERK